MIDFFKDINEIQGDERVPSNYQVPEDIVSSGTWEIKTLTAGDHSVEVIWVDSPNVSSRPQTTRIAIVNHQTSGLMDGCLSWMCNTQSSASAHFLVTRKGAIYYLIDERDGAIHAGEVINPTWTNYLNYARNPNQVTIGIEHETAVISNGSLTEEQYQATLRLHKYLIAKYNLPVDRDHIIGHCDIDSVGRSGCPGPAFPWDRLLTDLEGESDNVQKTSTVFNGNTYDSFIKDNEVYIKLRPFAEAAGYTVGWTGREALVSPDVLTIALPKEDGDKTNNNLISGGIRIGSSIYAPARALLEKLGFNVSWDSAAKQVNVTKP